MARAGAEPEEFGIVDQLRALRRRWPILAVCVGLGLAGVTLALQLLTPVWVARAELIYEPARGGPDGTEAVLAAPESSLVDSQVQQIASRALAREVVNRLALADDPGLRPAGAPWQAALQALRTAAGRAPAPGTTDALLDRFLDRLVVTREGKSHVIGIAWRSTDPRQAALVSNAVANAFVAQCAAEKQVAAKRVLDRLAQRRAELHDELVIAETRLAEARSAAGPTLAALDGGEDQLGVLSRQLVEARLDAGTRQSRAAQLRQAAKRGEANLFGTDWGQSAVLQGLVAEEAQSAREEAELLAQYGERHPKVIDHRNRHAQLKRKIQVEQNRMLKELELDSQVAGARAEDLARQIEALKGSAVQLAATRAATGRLEDELRARRLAYETFDLKAREIAERLNDPQPDARIVSEASPPSVPAFPRPLSFYAVGLTAALIVGGVLVWFLEVRDRGVRTARELERVTGLQTLAMIPLLDGPRERERPHDVPLEQPLGRYGEALRDMLAAVTTPFDRPEGRGVAVLMTSAVPDEGKTTTSISLARLAACEGLKVVLLDGDLRHPSVLGRLGLGPGPGLLEILAGRATLQQALRPDPRSALQVLPGSGARRAALVSQSGERLRQVIATLTRDYDLVVVDAAPALAVADTKLLARAVDHVLLIARWGTTTDRLIQRAVDELREVRAPLVGAVLSAVDLKKQARYGLDDRTFAYVKHKRYYAT